MKSRRKDGFYAVYIRITQKKLCQSPYKMEINNWKMQEIADLLKNGDEDICFSDYTRKKIDKMIARSQIRNARNYEFVLGHME